MVSLSLFNAATGRRMRFMPRRVLLAGYTARDRTAVQRHIDELAEQGIPPPPKVPVIYPGAPTSLKGGGDQAQSLQVDGELSASAGWSSGEVEFVLLVTRARTLVGVGSDHTDRELERTDMISAKQAFPKILGRVVWPLASLSDRWDKLMLCSWLNPGPSSGEGISSANSAGGNLYQEGALADIITPEDLLGMVEAAHQKPGLVLFSGTVPMATQAPRSGRWLFTGALLDGDGAELSRCQYAYVAAPDG